MRFVQNQPMFTKKNSAGTARYPPAKEREWVWIHIQSSLKMDRRPKYEDKSHIFLAKLQGGLMGPW